MWDHFHEQSAVAGLTHPPNPISEYLYLWSHGRNPCAANSTELVISAHGHYWPGQERIYTPTQLRFYVAHGGVLANPGLAVSHRPPVETLHIRCQVVNYRLTKYQERIAHRESYAEVESAAGLVLPGEGPDQYRDFLTIRARRNGLGGFWTTSGGGVPLQHVFDTLQARGLNYTVIHCSFCRNRAPI